MLYRPDWDKVQQRYTAWLAGQNDSPLLQAKAPKGPQTHGHLGWNFVQDTQHPECAFEAFERYCQQTHFAGDSIPNLFVNLGPGSPAACLGCSVRVMPDTVWFHDAEMSWNQILATRLDENEKWWKYTLDIYRMAGQFARGKYFVGGTDINAVMNILGSLRGTMKSCWWTWPSSPSRSSGPTSTSRGSGASATIPPTRWPSDSSKASATG